MFGTPIALSLVLVATIAARTQTTPATGETFKVDPVHSMGLFRVKHLGAGAFWGRFNIVTGTIRHDEKSKNGLWFDVAVDIASIDTGSGDLDNHLQTPEFFAATEHPKMTFKSKSARRVKPQWYKVTGDLTIRDTTKEVTVDVEWIGTRAGRMGKRCGFEAVFTVNRMDYGVAYGPSVIGKEIRITIAMEGVVPRTP